MSKRIGNFVKEVIWLTVKLVIALGLAITFVLAIVAYALVDLPRWPLRRWLIAAAKPQTLNQD